MIRRKRMHEKWMYEATVKMLDIEKGLVLCEVPCGIRRYLRAISQGVERSVARLMMIKRADMIVVPDISVVPVLQFKPEGIYFEMFMNPNKRWKINLRQKRIWLIEIKRVLSENVLGQILLYEKLLKEDWECIIERKIAVGEKIDYYATELLSEYGIEVYRLVKT